MRNLSFQADNHFSVAVVGNCHAIYGLSKLSYPKRGHLGGTYLILSMYVTCNVFLLSQETQDLVLYDLHMLLTAGLLCSFYLVIFSPIFLDLLRCLTYLSEPSLISRQGCFSGSQSKWLRCNCH